MKKRLFALLIVSLSIVTLYAQDVTFEVQYPSVVRVGQQFNVTWVVNVSGGDFESPSSFDGFSKLAGPQTSYSTSTQIVNGKVTRSTTNSYTFVLQAQSEGTFEIPSASFKYKNKTYTSNTAKIEVTANTSSSPSSSTQSSSVTGSTSSASSSGSSNADVSGEIYLDMAVSKREVYVGEPIVATVKLYTTANISGINDVSYPAFTGFLKTELETPKLTSLTNEVVNGVSYGTGVIQKFLLYPQVSGDLVIDPASATILRQQRISSGGGSGFGSIFDDFFGSVFDDFFGSFQSVPVNVSSKAVTIKVKPLPSNNKPSDFSGIVGRVNMSSSIDKDTVNVNDAVTLKITLSGSGNIRLASNPNLSLSPDIEVFDPKISDNLKSDANGTTGTRVFEYLLIPRHYGDYVIPSVSYSYFNPSTGEYETMSTNEYHFYANKTDESQSPTVFGGVSKEDVKYLGQDIRFIKNKGHLSKTEKLLAENKGFYATYALALLALLAVLFIRREHVRRNADIIAVRNRKAGKVATIRLKAAAECLKNGEIDKTYEEILKAIWGYLGDKLSMPISSLNRNNIAETLKQKGIKEENIEELTKVIDACEFARYSPSASENEASGVYEKAASFIKFLENTLD